MTENSEDREKEAIRAVIRAQCDAWNRGDADGFGATFSPDADYIAFDGTHWKGREQIIESHRELFNGFLKGTKLVGEAPTVRLLEPHVALVHGKGAAIDSKQDKVPRSKLSVNTSVAVKRDGQWLIAAFQNTRFRPWQETLLGRLILLFKK